MPPTMAEQTISLNPWLTILACILAYLLGSVSSGILVARAVKGPDLRSVGSGNTGASNVQRTMGWKYGLIVFFADALKGLLACFLGSLLTGSHVGALLAGLFAILGHNWPVFFGFKGGKGVATSCGVLLFCFPIPAVICFVVTIAIIAATRYISLGSMFLLISYACILTFSFHGPLKPWVLAWAWILAAICVFRHHANIGRLLKGTENKLGKKK